MQQPVALLLLMVGAGIARADSSPPSPKPERRMLSEWRLGWPAKLPCQEFSSVDLLVDKPIDLVLHGPKKPLTLSHTGGAALGAWHGPPGAGRRYPLPAAFDVTTIDRVTASRAAGVMLSFNCREKHGDVTWALTFRENAFGDVRLKSDTQLIEPALCRDAALGDKSSAAAEQKAMESLLAELARAVCRGVPCNDTARSILAAPMQAGAPSEFVADSTRGQGWRARFARPDDSLQCWNQKNPIGEDRDCVLQIGKISLRESCWPTRGDSPPHWVVSAAFMRLPAALLARQASGEGLWLTLSTDALEAAHP